MLILGIFAQIAWLASGPIFTQLVAPQIEAQLSEALEGQVRLRGLRGNLATSVGIAEITLEDGRGAVRSIRGLSLAERHTPSIVTRGASAIEALQARAERVEIDLDRALASSDQAEASQKPAPLLRSLLAELPAFAELEIAELVLHRQGRSLTMRASVRLDRTDGAVTAQLSSGELSAKLHVPNAASHGRVTAHIPDSAAWLPLLLPDSDFVSRADTRAIQTGRAALEATIALDANTESRVDVRIHDVAIAADRSFVGRALALDSIRTRAAWSASRVRIPHFDVIGRGLRLHARDVVLPDTTRSAQSVLAELSGEVVMQVDDVTQWSNTLPPAVRAEVDRFAVRDLRVDIRCRDGVARVRELRARGRGSRIRASSDPIALTRLASAAAKESGRFTFEAELDDDAPLEALRVETTQVVRARASGQATIDAQRIAGRFDARATLRDDERREATCTGTLFFEAESPFDASDEDARVSLRPDLVIEGSLARSASPMRVSGRLDIAGKKLDVKLDARVRASMDGDRGTLALVAKLPDSTSLRSSMGASEVEVQARAFDIAFLAPFLPEAIFASPSDRESFGGLANASFVLSPTKNRLELRADVRGVTPEAIRIAGTIDGQDERWQIKKFSVAMDDARLLLDGSLRGLPLRRALEALAEGATPELSLAKASIDAAGSLRIPELRKLGLERFGVREARGSIDASYDVATTSTQPQLKLRGFVRDAGCTLGELRLAKLSTRITIDEDGSLAIDELRCDVNGRRIEASARGARDGAHWALSSLELAQGGRKTLRARLRAKAQSIPELRTTWRESLEADIELLGLNLPQLLALPEVDTKSPWARLGPVRGRLRVALASAQQVTGEIETSLRTDGANVYTARAEIRGDARSLSLADVTLRAVEGTPLPALEGNAKIDGTSLRQILEEPSILNRASLRAALRCRSFDLAKLPALTGIEDLAGRCDGTIDVAGPLNAPRFRVDIGVADGEVRIGGMPRIQKIRGRLRGDQNELRVQDILASMGAAPIKLSGRVRPKLSSADFTASEVALTLVGENALLWRRDGLRIRAGLDLAIDGRLDGLTVGGQVRVTDSKLVGRIPWIEFRRSGGLREPGRVSVPGLDESSGIRGKYALRITTDDPIAVKTNVLRGGLTTALELSGSLAQPILVGTIACVAREEQDARLSLPGIGLRLTTALVDFDRKRPGLPSLNIVASGRRHGHDVTMIVRGRSDQPEALFSSTPPLPPEDLAVLVATGARPADLRRSGARGVGTIVGSYLAEELADYIFGSDSTEAKQSFVERFTIETGTEISANGNASIVVSFRALPRVWLEGERDIYEDINFGVVYRIRFH